MDQHSRPAEVTRLMREQLLGYLLGALDDGEHDQIEQMLEKDQHLRQQLRWLDAQLEPLRSDRFQQAPPPGLAARTCAAIESHQQEHRAVAARSQMAMMRDRPPGSRWTLNDAMAAAGVIVAASLLFFPAIASSRYQSRLAVCQNNLRQLGQVLGDYSDRHDGYFPNVPPAGNRSVAGIYAPLLKDAELLTDDTMVICPSSTLAGEKDRWVGVPTLEEFDRARGPALISFQRNMGGSYGYHWGHLSEGVYRPTRNLGRSHFALMSDSPNPNLAGRRTANHGSRGQNVLFEDGCVRFIVDCCPEHSGDNFFHSDRGLVEPGCHVDDSVIVDSITPLLFETRRVSE